MPNSINIIKYLKETWRLLGTIKKFYDTIVDQKFGDHSRRRFFDLHNQLFTDIWLIKLNELALNFIYFTNFYLLWRKRKLSKINGFSNSQKFIIRKDLYSS